MNGSRVLRIGFVVLVLLTCLRVWVGPGSFEVPAQAQIPDGGKQRKELLDEARMTNQLLLDIKHLLEKGTLNVRLEGADNQAPAPARKGGTDK